MNRPVLTLQNTSGERVGPPFYHVNKKTGESFRVNVIYRHLFTNLFEHSKFEQEIRDAKDATISNLKFLEKWPCPHFFLKTDDDRFVSWNDDFGTGVTKLDNTDLKLTIVFLGEHDAVIVHRDGSTDVQTMDESTDLSHLTVQTIVQPLALSEWRRFVFVGEAKKRRRVQTFSAILPDGKKLTSKKHDALLRNVYEQVGRPFAIDARSNEVKIRSPTESVRVKINGELLKTISNVTSIRDVMREFPGVRFKTEPWEKVPTTVVIPERKPRSSIPVSGLRNDANRCFADTCIMAMLSRNNRFVRDVLMHYDSHEEPCTKELRSILLNVQNDILRNRYDITLEYFLEEYDACYDDNISGGQHDATEFMRKMCTRLIGWRTIAQIASPRKYYRPGSNVAEHGMIADIDPVKMVSVIDIPSDELILLSENSEQKSLTTEDLLNINIVRIADDNLIQKMYERTEYSLQHVISNSPFVPILVGRVIHDHTGKEQTLDVRVRPLEQLQGLDLTAVICHRGSAKRGHYVAYLKLGTSWYFYNDVDKKELQFLTGKFDELLGLSKKEYDITKGSIYIYSNTETNDRWKDIFRQSPVFRGTVSEREDDRHSINQFVTKMS